MSLGRVSRGYEFLKRRTTNQTRFSIDQNRPSRELAWHVDRDGAGCTIPEGRSRSICVL